MRHGPGFRLAEGVEIRTADPSDWEAIWPFWSAIVDAGETYAYPEPARFDAGRELWFEPPPAETVVAVDGTRVVGSAKMGPNRPGRGAHIATASFMVDPAVQGRGIGRALGEYVVDRARESGYRGMQFNAVAETNVGAVRLWQSLGFTILTTVPGAFDHRTNGLVGLHVMFQEFTPHD